LIETKGMLFRRQYTNILLILEPIVAEFHPISSKAESRGGGPPGEKAGPPDEAVLLRIFVGEDDHYKRLPLYEAIVLKAREMHLAGATVLRGILGFGKSSRMHTARVLRLSMDLPMVIEIVDAREKIDTFLPHLEAMMGGGLVTLERARVIRSKQVIAQKRFSH
jgi:PII-like signaling protein